MYNYARTYNNIFHDAINVKLLKMSFLSGNNCILFIKVKDKKQTEKG